MRVFAKDMIKNMMGRLGISEDQPIENRIISRSLEGAQKRIEGFNFDSRKRVLEFDDVLNFHRKIMYERRRHILEGNFEMISTSLNEVIEGDDKLMGIIEDKKKTLGQESFTLTFKQLLLQTIDMFWIEHLEAMEYVRGSVNLRAYGQRDPLVEYKKEGLRMFRGLESALRNELISFIENLDSFFANQQAQALAQNSFVAVIPDATGAAPNNAAASGNAHEKIGRNDPCPCGSCLLYTSPSPRD